MTKRLSAATRVALGLMFVVVSLVMLAHRAGLVPDAAQAELQGRKSLCEALAVQFGLASQRGEGGMIGDVLQAVVARDPKLLSAGIRRDDGDLAGDFGPHDKLWPRDRDVTGSPDFATIPIQANGRPWGRVELCFQPLEDGAAGWLGTPWLRLAVFTGSSAFLVFLVYLRRIFQHLDPSAVIPQRVQMMLDNLVEGVLVLDRQERIVLANRAAAQHLGQSSASLQGRSPSQVPWLKRATQQLASRLPWTDALAQGTPHKGVLLELEQEQGRRTFVVNSVPIQGDDGRQRGVLTTFDDVTSVERKNQQLEVMLSQLNESRNEVCRRNEELQVLATRDPLTGCLNRRAFFQAAETLWKDPRPGEPGPGCTMIDVDHFKNVNDQHGHAKGDEVLQGVARILNGAAGEGALVCRFGGEEFCVFQPAADRRSIVEIAETLRRLIETAPLGGLSVTASFGCALAMPGGSPQQMLELADKSLYCSKESGRNRVTFADDLPPDYQPAKNKHANTRSAADSERSPIPFRAVTALISALSYRDVRTADHSRRVADLCVRAARALLPQRDCYVLEVAALLHDVGKLGVPDAILLKPGPLDEAEWEVMRKHDRIGAEILTSAFSSPELTAIVGTYRLPFGRAGEEGATASSPDVPLGARILAVADAYDAMVSDQVFRRGRSRDEAFAELRRCAGRQFDPAVVERFIEAVSADDGARRAAPSDDHASLAVRRIGEQVQRLADAVEARNYDQLAALAGRLADMGRCEGLTAVADMAEDLSQAAAKDPDLLTVVSLANSLLEICQAARPAADARAALDAALNKRA